ncbi:ATP-binding protein [Candidatus Methanomassiliicoccus intestinalis]|uniref:ATP-binding protein n=1 Tax=Candidatus Methanomassiliicoccus intestinalis TaxID=1406512 RepID=UPI0037DD32EE
MSGRQIERTNYLQRLASGKDRTEVVKVITGIRRCGKSTLMCQYIDQLKTTVAEENIVYLNMESRNTEALVDYHDLNEYLHSKLNANKRTYVFLDEIQRIDGWEQSINSLMVDYDADIYITGSNAFILSSELSTYLSGRYVEINMLPLSFKEYLELYPPYEGHDRYARFHDYLWYGALPMIDPDGDHEFTNDHLLGIYNTIMNKDVQHRLGLHDPVMLDNMARYVMSNIGNITSSKAIAENAEISPLTVRNYLRALEEAYIIYKTYRYDVRGKKLLKTREKYYVSDTGLRNSVLGNAAGDDISRQIENVVYLELRRRGYTVNVGSYRDYEIDFTARKRDTIEYFQVTQTLLPDEVYKREVRSLKLIDDNFSKTILSLDPFTRNVEGGIKHLNLLDWLLEY